LIFEILHLVLRVEQLVGSAVDHFCTDVPKSQGNLSLVWLVPVMRMIPDKHPLAFYDDKFEFPIIIGVSGKTVIALHYIFFTPLREILLLLQSLQIDILPI